MHVAVLGGGLQGCLIALALAAERISVTLFERHPALMCGAAIANEGKIHLGFMYAADPSLRTARMMMRGALAFAPFLERHLGIERTGLPFSTPTIYVVHRDSLKSAEAISGHLAAVHALVSEAAAGASDAYFGIDLGAAPREWSAAERESTFDPSHAVAAFETPETSIDPAALVRAVADRVADEPRIEIRLNRTVLAVEQAGGRVAVVSDGEGGRARDAFDQVANALWDGRIAVDATLGLKPSRPWLHRFRYGIRARPDSATTRPPTATITLGPFGEVVNCADGFLYLMWYPACLAGSSDAMIPPVFPISPAAPDSTRLLTETLRALSHIILPLADIDASALTDFSVKGGPIVAWGKTDIDDPASRLHQRFEIGVTTHGRYHTVDPGKLTMVPYFAGLCVERILSA